MQYITTFGKSGADGVGEWHLVNGEGSALKSLEGVGLLVGKESNHGNLVGLLECSKLLLRRNLLGGGSKTLADP
jgi:hypothetical protein